MSFALEFDLSFQLPHLETDDAAPKTYATHQP
jgi:hypothetical protein